VLIIHIVVPITTGGVVFPPPIVVYFPQIFFPPRIAQLSPPKNLCIPKNFPPQTPIISPTPQKIKGCEGKIPSLQQRLFKTPPMSEKAKNAYKIQEVKK